MGGPPVAEGRAEGFGLRGGASPAPSGPQAAGVVWGGGWGLSRRGHSPGPRHRGLGRAASLGAAPSQEPRCGLGPGLLAALARALPTRTSLCRPPWPAPTPAAPSAGSCSVCRVLGGPFEAGPSAAPGARRSDAGPGVRRRGAQRPGSAPALRPARAARGGPRLCALSQMKGALTEIIQLATLDSDPWVLMVADILKSFPDTGALNLDLEEQNPNVQDILGELREKGRSGVRSAAEGACLTALLEGLSGPPHPWLRRCGDLSSPRTPLPSAPGGLYPRAWVLLAPAGCS